MSSVIKQKIILLLSAGINFSYSYSYSKKSRIIEDARNEWMKIDWLELQKGIKSLYRSKLIDKKYNSDGSCSISLTDKGKIKILSYKFSEMRIESKVWDGKWRIVIFDIPEKIRRGRNAIRWKLKLLGFYELQKSTFVFPYECRDEIEFLIEYFGLKKYVRYGILEEIDNDIHLREIFGVDIK